eukprot:COSAG01_NODE_1915_length_8918_cov_21.920853_6_plen_191_part_00
MWKIDSLNKHQGRGLLYPSAKFRAWSTAVERLRQQEGGLDLQLRYGSKGDQKLKVALTQHRTQQPSGPGLHRFALRSQHVRKWLRQNIAGQVAPHHRASRKVLQKGARRTASIKHTARQQRRARIERVTSLSDHAARTYQMIFGEFCQNGEALFVLGVEVLQGLPLDILPLVDAPVEVVEQPSVILRRPP